MVKHQRATSLIRLLARLGWQRDPDLWTVRCRDGRGRRARLRIHLTTAGLTVAPSSPGPWTLTPLEAGRLRGAVRDALLSFDRLAGNGPAGARPVARSTETTPPRPPGKPVPRQRVRLDPPCLRPSVAEIAARIIPTIPPDPEVNHVHQTDNPDHHAAGTSVAA